jgi:hypothetical protein
MMIGGDESLKIGITSATGWEQFKQVISAHLCVDGP